MRLFGSVLSWGLLLLASVGSDASAEQPAEARRDVRIAMCQIFALESDREGNFVRIENAIAEAKEKGAEIVCLPETTVLGWVNPAAHQRAFPIPGKDSDRLAALAKKYAVYLAVGVCEKDGDRLHDSALLIDPSGKILMKHRKINILTSWMTPPYTPGKDVTAVDTEFGKIGMLICADTFKESICRRMEALEPDLVIIPYGWAAWEKKWPKHADALKKVVTRAAGWIGAPVVGTDLVGQIGNGPAKGAVYGGASVAAMPDGTILAQTTDRDRDIKIFTVTLPSRSNKPKADLPSQ